MDTHMLVPPRPAIAAPLGLALCLGCYNKLPTGPAELTTGITVYANPDFGGASAHITHGISDLADFVGPCRHSRDSADPDDLGAHVYYDWDGCISSVRVAPGWRATLYRRAGYRGESLDVAVDMPYLDSVPGTCPRGGLDNCLSSVRVTMQ